MNEETRRRSAYLEALARLQPRWDHDAKDHLGAVKIQFDVLVTLLADEPGSTVEIAKLTPYIDRGLSAIQKFLAAMAVQHGVWRWDSTSGDLYDAGAHVAKLGLLLEPCARLQMKVPFSVAAPPTPVWIEGGEPALREAVTIAAAEMLFLASPGEPVSMRLDADAERAALRIQGPRRPADSTPWLTVVRETLAKFGGRVESGGELSLDLIIPMAAVPR